MFNETVGGASLEIAKQHVDAVMPFRHEADPAEWSSPLNPAALEDTLGGTQDPEGLAGVAGSRIDFDPDGGAGDGIPSDAGAAEVAPATDGYAGEPAEPLVPPEAAGGQDQHIELNFMRFGGSRPETDDTPMEPCVDHQPCIKGPDDTELTPGETAPGEPAPGDKGGVDPLAAIKQRLEELRNKRNQEGGPSEATVPGMAE